MDSGLTDIALRGLEAARVLVDRFAEAVDGAERAGAPDAGRPAGEDPVEPTDVMGRAWADLLRTTADAWNGAARARPTGDGTVLVAGGPAPVLTVAAPAGAAATVALWLHNQTNEAVTDVRVTCGPLRAPSGHEIPETAVAADPADVGPVPGRSSREISIRVEVPPGSLPACYRGLIQVDGLVDAWALVELRVGPSEATTEARP